MEVTRERLARLTGFWNWLPAFRAVAETQHLPTAARTMRLSASALSRSVSQLEGALGTRLFERSKRRMQLNDAGSELLAAVRDAMRRIDDGLGRMTAERPTSLRVAGDGAWVALLLVPAIGDRAVIEHVDLGAVDVRDGLLRGLADVAIVETVVQARDLVVERLGGVAQAVFTARKHSPAAYAACTTDAVVWPAEVARAIVLRSRRLDPLIEACSSGALRAILPRVIGAAHGLRALTTPRLPASHLYLIRRSPLGTSAVEALVPHIREQARALLVTPSR